VSRCTISDAPAGGAVYKHSLSWSTKVYSISGLENAKAQIPIREALLLSLGFTPSVTREEKMQSTIRYSANPATIVTWLLSLAILISAGLNTAQAQDSPKKGRAALARACGKELNAQCNGVPVHANNMLECLQKNQEKLSRRCAGLANNVVRACDRDAVQLCQGVVAGGGNILGCLTAAKSSVSSHCNAALDAAFLR
jgi:hypothetical protein